MQGNAIPFSRCIEGARMQLIIPVYQRNYDWTIDNCNQLFNDLVKLKNSNRPKHFFGSIVTTVADTIGNNRLVIDGQQRITTISLLLIAAIHAVNNHEMKIEDKSKIDYAFEVFLKANFCSGTRKQKLVPIENDMVAYDRIFEGIEDKFIENSKMTRNYKHFYKKITTGEKPFTFDELLDVIERLQIISIELEATDDAQLIFESLNSTGLALTEADKIRNYLLMSLLSEEQKECYKNYWQKIEILTDYDPSMFLRDYLAIIQQSQRPVQINSLYYEWKKYMDGRERKTELIQMLEYAEYYNKVSKGYLGSEKLSTKMKHICNLKTDVVNLFFIPFLKYADKEMLEEKDVYDVIDLIENFLARRIICSIPSNALTQVFCALHREVVRSYKELSDAGIPHSYKYADILSYHLLRREGNYQLPRDTQFVEAIKQRDAYHLPKPAQVFIFERLENSINGEKNDVAKMFENKEVSIEHIMPQTLTNEWRIMLGQNADAISEMYLHTFANLTLTGINSELSNKPFNIKRDGYIDKDGNKQPGYKESIYRMTNYVKTCDQWTEVELKNRADAIASTFLKLYPLPKSEYKPLAKPFDEILFEDESFNPTNRNIRGYILFGESHSVSTWKDMLVEIVEIVNEKYSDVVDTLYDAGAFFWSSPNESYCTKLSTGKYLWTSMDNRNKIRCLHYLFDKCNIDESELVLLLEPIKNILS